MGHYLVLETEWSLVVVKITSEEVLGLAMTKQDRVRRQHGLSLLFKSVVGVNCFNDPSRVVRIVGIHAGFLVANDRRVNCGAFWCAAQVKTLAISVAGAFNFDLLTVTNDVIRSKNVDFLRFLDNKYRSRDRSWCLCRSGKHVGLEESWAPVGQVHDQETCRFLVLNHDRVS